MPWKRLTLTLLLASITMLTAACGTTRLRVSQIPLRTDLTRCVALLPVPSEEMPRVSEDPATRATQVQERAFWMRRDLEQTANNRDMCGRQAELVTLIQTNNAGPEQ